MVVFPIALPVSHLFQSKNMFCVNGPYEIECTAYNRNVLHTIGMHLCMLASQVLFIGENIWNREHFSYKKTVWNSKYAETTTNADVLRLSC